MRAAIKQNKTPYEKYNKANLNTFDTAEKLSANVSSQVKKQTFWDFPVCSVNSTLLLFHPGLGTGNGGDTEMNYQSADRAR